MDFVKGQLVRSKAGRDKTLTYAVLDVEGEYWPWPMAATARWQTRSAKRAGTLPPPQPFLATSF